jgi:transcriptional regulator with XRE-family HTH domain
MTLKIEKVREIQNLRKKGYTLPEIAKECGVSVKTAWKYSQNIMPDRDYLELKLKDMRDTITEMRGLITLMIAEREKCRKACSDLNTAMLERKNAIRSIQDARDMAISEMKKQKDAILGNLASEIERIKSIVDTLISARDGIDAKYREICEFRDRLRDLLVELASFRDRIDDERWISYFNRRIDEMLGKR